MVGDHDGDGGQNSEGGDESGVPGRGDDDGEGKSLTQSVEPIQTKRELTPSNAGKRESATHLTLTVMTPLTPMSRVIPARTFSVTLLSPETNVETAPCEVMTPPTTTLTPPSIVCA